eukprot:Nitzschia sp. Nitz4//scaffold95_size97785//2765//5123//NITZ4_004654-RA/size97785-augustus-gene-0.94-mRNA-1//1//CDS//3329560433//8455//frame0
MTDLENPENKHETNTVDEDYFSDEEEDVELVEYVDVVDEGYFTPSILMLLVLVLLIGGAIAGIIIGVKEGQERQEPKSAPTTPPTATPSMMPSASPSASPSMSPSFAPSEGYTCPICLEGNITSPDTLITIPTWGNQTCSELEVLADAGNITEAECTFLQLFAQGTCGCATEDVGTCGVCSSGVVRNQTAVIDTSVLGIEGFTSITCAEMSVLSTYTSVSNATCSAIQALTETVCDCGEFEDELYVCPICGDGEVTNTQGLVTVGVTEIVSCANLLTFATQGLILEEDCPAIQTAAEAPCECTSESDEEAQVLEYLFAEVGQAVYEEGTSEYLAAQYLINEDPRFTDSSRRRALMPLNSRGSVTISNPALNNTNTTNETGDDNQEGGGTLPPMVPPLVDAQIGISVLDLTKEEMLQRYLVILLYFATTDNRASSWTSDCAEVVALNRRRLATNCTFGDSETAATWLSDAFECDWAGVECNVTTAKITALNLVGMGLDGTIPSELGLLTAMTAIDLSENEINGTFPKDFVADISALEYIALSSNSLTGTIPAMPTTALKYLDISGNELTGDLTGALSATSLEGLDVNDNKFEGPLVALADLFVLPSLLTLKLGLNFFNGALPTEFSSSLVELDVHDNNLDGTIPTGMANMVNLTDLDLSVNAFEGSLPTELGALTQLETLNVSSNYLTGTIPAELSSAQSLMELSISKNEFTGSLPSDICAIEVLDIVVADCSEITCDCCSECCVDTSETSACTAVVV